MKKIYTAATTVSRVAVFVSYAGVVFAMLLTVYDITRRFFFNSPLLGTYELIEITMACVVFASLAYTQTQKGHIHVVMLIKLLPARLRMVLYAVNAILAAGITGIVAYAAYEQAQYAAARQLLSPSLYLPLSPFYYVEMIGMAIFSVVLFLDAARSVVAIFDTVTAEEVQAEWI